MYVHAGKAHGTRSSKLAYSKNLENTSEASSSRQPTETNWDLCVLYQQNTGVSLVCPLKEKAQRDGASRKCSRF